RDASEELGLPQVITTALYRRIGALLLPREYISQPCILEFCFLALHNFSMFPCISLYMYIQCYGQLITLPPKCALHGSVA
ncbi:hypothetical protein GBAR_LOCUS31388, partial [Geodia barretti]